jgi:hypothetical protein
MEFEISRKNAFLKVAKKLKHVSNYLNRKGHFYFRFGFSKFLAIFLLNFLMFFADLKSLYSWEKVENIRKYNYLPEKLQWNCEY